MDKITWCHTTKTQDSFYIYKWTISNFAQRIRSTRNDHFILSDQLLIKLAQHEQTAVNCIIYPNGKGIENLGTFHKLRHLFVGF